MKKDDEDFNKLEITIYQILLSVLATITIIIVLAVISFFFSGLFVEAPTEECRECIEDCPYFVEFFSEDRFIEVDGEYVDTLDVGKVREYNACVNGECSEVCV